MRLFGNVVARIKAALVPVRGSSWWGSSLFSSSFWGGVRESFAGAWQRNITVESTQNILAFSAVYACVSLIAEDIAKLRIKLTELQDNGIWSEVVGSPLSPVLRKPNRYQTRIQFISQWIVSKLLHGNTYVLKERDNRRVVVALYVLDPRLVTPLVAEDGGVYYQLQTDIIAGVPESVTIPASEIIHDRMLCLWHPLIGVSPIYACGASATQGTRIQNNSEVFFANMSRPSGHLAAPGNISDDQIERIQATFERKFSGANIGRMLITGDGMKYEPMTIPAQDAQLIEQLRWTAEDVCRPFHVPPYKLGLAQPTLSNVAALNQEYYSQCLQTHIEALELCLDEGLGLPDIVGKTYGTECDLDGLLRMDPLTMADQQEKQVRAGVMAPNEARLRSNLSPVDGGESPYLQQQNYSLSALAKRDAQPDPFASKAPAVPALPAPSNTPEPDDDKVKAFLDRVRSGFEHA